MKVFFQKFFQEHRKQILFFSFLRIIAFIQVLFWPYAFAKVINIVSINPKAWHSAIGWIVLMGLNKITEDWVRLRSKFGLEKIGAELKISLATFFSRKTEIREGRKTGEAVQAVKKASEDIEVLVNFYKDKILQLPINLVIIPIIFWQASKDYLFLLIAYGLLYLLIDYFSLKIYYQNLKRYFKKAEIFWGTTYRKTPEVWRQRENGCIFADTITEEGKDLYQAIISAVNVNNWRWIILQSLSSASRTAAVFLVVYKIFKGRAPIGDLIIVNAYLQKTQTTLNIITDTLINLIRTKISLKRLGKAVKIKE